MVFFKHLIFRSLEYLLKFKWMPYRNWNVYNAQNKSLGGNHVTTSLTVVKYFTVKMTSL